MKPALSRKRAGRFGTFAAATSAIMGLMLGGLSVLPATALPVDVGVQSAAAAASTFAQAPSAPVQKDPQTVYLEDFENQGDKSPFLLTDYVGASGMRYSASDSWLKYCNGWVMKAGDPEPAGGIAECQTYSLTDPKQPGQKAWDVLLGDMARSLGDLNGKTGNHAVAAQTDPATGNPAGVGPMPGGDNQVQFETRSPITNVKAGRYLSFAVDVASSYCKVGQPEFKFYFVTNGNVMLPTFTNPINPCLPGKFDVNYPERGFEGVNVGHYFSDGSQLVDGSDLGIRMINGNTWRSGNDAAFDNVRIIDSTPSLSKSFSDPDAARTSTLKFTVTNTSENSSKAGWSFDDEIDSRLAINTAQAKTTCTNGTVSFAGQTMKVTGDLATGQASCEITVPVTAPATGSYANCPTVNVKNVVGLDGPECATLYVGDYTVKKSANPATGTALVSGQKATYTLTLTPTADSPADAVIPATLHDSMADVLDDATYNNDIAVSAGSPAATVQSNGDIDWAGNLTAGKPVTITYSVTVKSTPTGGDNSLKNLVVRGGETPPPTCDPATEKCTVHPVLVPGLKLSKSADPASGTAVKRGSTVKYSVVAENTGETNLTAVKVSDNLADVLDDATIVADSLSSSTGSDPTLSGTMLSWTGNIAKGQKVTLTYEVTVKTDSIAAATLLNKVTGSGTGPGNVPVPSNCVTGVEVECTTTHPVTALVPGLAVKKSADPASGSTVVRGSEVTYTVVASNTGETDLTGVTVTDNLADVLDDADLVAGSLTASAGAVPTVSGSTLSWTGNIAQGAKVTLTYKVKVKTDFSSAATLVNTIVGKGTAPGGSEVPSNCVTGVEVDCTTTHEVPATSVKIEKTDNKQSVAPGETLTYDVTVTNTGADAVTNVVAVDSLPAGVTYVSATDAGTYDSAARTVTWNVGSVAAGAVKVVHVTVTVNADVLPGQKIENLATVTTDQGCTDDPATPADECRTIDIDEVPSLSIVKDDRRQVVAPGQAVTYDVSVTNNGTVDATDVQVSDVLPLNLEFVSANENGDYNAILRTVNWTVDTLAAGETKTVQVTVTVSESVVPGDTVRNIARVGGPEGCVDNPATPVNECESIDIDNVPSISISKTDGKDVVLPGETSSYDLTVKNTGEYDAPKVVVTDVLPANLTFVSATDGGVYDAAVGTVTWSIGDLPVGAEKVVTVVATVSASAVPNEAISNTAKVTTDELCVDDPATEANECETTDIDRVPAVKIVKDDGKTIVKPGETVTYTLTATNYSDYDAPKVVVRDVMPENVDFIESSVNGIQSLDNKYAFEWDLGTIKAGESRVITVTVKVHAGLDPETRVINTATISTNDTCIDDPSTEVNECESTDIDRTPSNVWILKDNNQKIVSPGQEVTYTLTVGNSSQEFAISDAVVTDPLPENLAFISAAEGGTYDAATRTVTWKLATLEPGSTAVVQVTTRVADSVKAGDKVLNTAAIDIPEGCIDEESCGSTDEDGVPNVTIAKDDHRQEVSEGDSLTYDLTVRNEYDDAADKVVVSDALPANVTFVSANNGGTYNASTRTVTWELGSLAPSETRVVQVTVTVNAGATGNVVNVASVTTADGCLGAGCSATDTDTMAGKLALTGAAPIFGIVGIIAALQVLIGAAFIIRRRRSTQA